MNGEYRDSDKMLCNIECAHNMLKGKNLPNGFCVEEINTIVYLKNKSMTKRIDLKTPFEALLGFKPAVNHLRVFSLKIFSHVPKEDRKSLDSKPIKFIFIGCCT